MYSGMVLGVASVLVLCKVKLPAINLRELAFSGHLRAEDWAFGGWLPDWWPVIAFPWWVLVGCLVCFAVSFIFATPVKRVETAATICGPVRRSSKIARERVVGIASSRR